MPEIKVIVPNIDKLKVQSSIVEEKVQQDGETFIEKKVVTAVSFQYEGTARHFDQVLMAMANKTEVHFLFGSPQAIMALAEQEPVSAKN